VSGTPPTGANGAISPSQALQDVGTYQTVLFHVTYTHTDNAGTEFLDQKTDYTNGFVVVIFASTVGKFSDDPANTYLNETISVSGTIKFYDNEYAEIVVNDPSQVRQGAVGSIPTTTVPLTSGPLSIPSPSTTTTSPTLPVAYRYATSTLDWAGYSISDATCAVGPSGSVDVTGTAVVPPVAAGSVVVGEVEAWLLDTSGNVIAVGTPAVLQQTPDGQTWSVDNLIDLPRAASCLVQGINPNYPYNVPQ
jgi:hypothetical protein